MPPKDKPNETKLKEQRAKLWKTVGLLRLFASPSDKRKIKVRITQDVPDDLLADCTQRKDYYLIRLNKTVVTQSPDTIYLLLAHEWAHALAWEFCAYDHGDAWGLAYAKCWRVVTGEINAGDLINVGMD